MLRWLGMMPTGIAVLVLAAATLIGVVLTLITGSEPGLLLGFFITVGAVAAAFGIRRGAVYLMFPLPAFAFFVAAFITGKVHDSSLTSSTTGLGVGGLQWIADIFIPMLIATIAVLLAGGARWVLAHQLVIGQVPASAGRAGTAKGARPAPRLGPDNARPARPDNARPARTPREQRPDRDPWGDPRQPPMDPRSGADARDDHKERPATPGRIPPGGEPRDRAPRSPSRPPWDDRPQGAGQPRRPRPQSPRDPWDSR